MMLALLLLLPRVASAEYFDTHFTPPEEAHAKAVLERAQATWKAAESGPSCTYLDQLSSASFQGAPPRDACPASFKAYEQLAAFDRHLRDSCREFSAWANVKLRAPVTATRQELRHKRRLAQGLELQPNGDYEPSPDHNPDIDIDFPRAEQTNMACALPVTLIFHYRKKALTRMQALYGNAERVLDGDSSNEDFFRFLDHGED